MKTPPPASIPVFLPQHDLLFNRAENVVKRRALYSWDYSVVGSLPMLAIQGIEQTGLLDIYDVLHGSYVGLPEEEHPDIDWALKKVEHASDVLYDVLEQIPKCEWNQAFIAMGAAAALEAPHLVVTWRKLGELGEAREDRAAFLPRPEDLKQTLVEAVEHLFETITDTINASDSIVSQVSSFLGRRTPAQPRELNAGRHNPLPARLRGVAAIVRSALEFVTNVDAKPVPLRKCADYSLLSAELKVSEAGLKGVTHDIDFARARLAGANPLLLRRVRTAEDLPSGFPVTDRHLQDALVKLRLPDAYVRGLTLAGAAEAGQLYVVDFAMLDGIPLRAKGPERDFFGRTLSDEPRQRFLPVPFGLFFQARSEHGGNLLPIALQAGRDPAVFEIFTPSDEEAWNNAKACFECADFHHHELFTHLYGVHFALEPLVVTTRRQLSVRHPISVLLAPSFESVLWNNFLGRQWLANEDGLLDQLMAVGLKDGTFRLLERAAEQATLWDANLPRRMERQGLDDTNALPDYPFRDDGMLHWEALDTFVKGYLGLYYGEDAATGDAAVVADHEVQAWFQELRAPSPHGGAVRGLPETLDTLDTLCEMITTVLFLCGPLHSAVNYSQYEQMGSVAEKPCAIYADPARLKDVTLLELLPPSETALTQMRALHLLASLQGDTWSQVDLSWYPDPKAWSLVAALRQRMSAIEVEILERNTTRRPGYFHLLPSKVAVAGNV
ncbi:MAG: lipoxygenase family protein [Myxococcota bacterium]